MTRAYSALPKLRSLSIPRFQARREAWLKYAVESFALKVLLSTIIKDTNALERFRREAPTPARIDSDHVVRVTDADVAPELKGAPFLVMEYLRGEDLEGYLLKMGGHQSSVLELNSASSPAARPHGPVDASVRTPARAARYPS